jgi:hypothetical protein
LQYNQFTVPRIPFMLALLAIAASIAGAADRPVSFSKDIQPILETSCWKCHGGTVQVAKLDLRTRESALKGAEHGIVLVPGKAENSRLYRLVAGLDQPRMPMNGKLTPAQIETIKLWIDQGAPWEAVNSDARNWWAFKKPMRPPVPAANKNPIDAFLMKAMQAQGVKPAPPADRQTLLRRAYIDLIGLPPTLAQAAEFLDDKSPDAWPKLIDRLLASPQYGERWGRHWLDVARYADSNGFEHDFDRPNAWRYRDYVIRSFNDDKPYNQFLREQIAGDELDNVTPDGLIATGFLRSYAKVGYREKDNPEFRYEYLDDMIATIGRGILGLTVQCARCHDHKFDPIPQTDYYHLQASLFGSVEADLPLTSAGEALAYETKTAEINARVNEIRQKIRTLENPYRDKLLPAKYKRFPQNVQDAIAVPEAQRTPGQQLLASQVIRTVSVSSSEIDRIMKPEDLAEKRRLDAQIAAINKERPKPIPVAMGMTDGDYRFTPDGPGDEPAPGKGVKREAIEGSYLHTGPARYQVPPAYLLIRGDVNSRGPEMKPGFVSVITYGNPPVELPPASGHTSGRRRAMAEWLVSPENPLTARVIVNRIWHHHFGRGIVPTLDNFGKMGELPANQELLDWLAVEFMDRGWSVKQMHRLLMTSQAYQMTSQFDDASNMAKDPEDRLCWRFRMQRLDAEILRDSILAVSGTLNTQMFGKPVFPKLPQEILAQTKEGIWLDREDGPEVWRRSIYIYRKRGLPFPLLDAFDLPNQNISCGARNVTTVPTQALTLMNDEFILRQAQLFANRLEEAASADPRKQVELGYRLALSRSPEAEERKLALEFLAQHKLADFAHVLLNLNEFLYVR